MSFGFFHFQFRLCLVPLVRWCRFRCGDIPPYRVSYGKTYPHVVVWGTNPVCVSVGHVLVEVVYDCKIQLRFLPLEKSNGFFHETWSGGNIWFDPLGCWCSHPPGVYMGPWSCRGLILRRHIVFPVDLGFSRWSGRR